MGFNKKRVLITGGSSGIGAATAIRLAHEGAMVFISYRKNEHGAQNVLNRVSTGGGVAFSVRCDLADPASIESMLAQTEAELGGIDILINNAGNYIAGDEWNGLPEVWARTLQENLVGTMCVSKKVAEMFIKQQSGVIVSIASRLGVLGNYEELAYGASKAGVINITQAYARLLAPFGRANSISPGAVKTGHWATAPQEELEKLLTDNPLDRLVEVDEVVESIVFLASDNSRMITGQNIVLGAGYMRK